MNIKSKNIYIRSMLNSVLFGIAVWMIDSIMDFLFFYEKSFLELTITDVPAHEIYIRSIFFLALIIFGIINAKNLVKLKKSNQDLTLINSELDATIQQLSANEQQLRATNQQLIASEADSTKKAHDLGERMKELNCLYTISESIWKNQNIETILRDAVNIIPLSWHYPEITSGRITYDGKIFLSKNFGESKWTQSAQIFVDKEITGQVEVFYSEEKPHIDEGPFMEEERMLIDAIANNLGRAIEKTNFRKQLDYERSQLKFHEKQFKAIFNGINDIMYVSDPDTFEIVHVNDIALKTFGDNIIGKKCYEVLQGKSEVCSFCTNHKIFGENYGNTYVWEYQNDSNHRWYRCTDKAIQWPDGRKLRFELASDITDQVKLKEELVSANQQLKANEQQLKASNLQLQRIQTALTENEIRYKQAESIANTGSWEYNLETTHFWGSDEAKRIYGFDPETDHFTTEQVESCIPERERVHQALVDLIEKDKAYDLKFNIITKNTDESRYIRSIAVLEKDNNGKPIKVNGAIVDITEQIKANKQIKESQERFKLVVEASKDGIWDWNIKSNYVYYSPGWKKILELENVPLEFSTWVSRIHPEDKEDVLETINKHLNGESQLWEFEHRLRLPNNEYKWVLGRGSVVMRDKKNKPVRMVGTMSDIQERKVNERLLLDAKRLAEENETRFKALHNASFGGITIHDKGWIIDCNQGLSEITGYSVDELIGMNGLLLISEETRDMVLANILAKYEKPYEAIGIRKNGQKYPVRLEARMIPYKGREVRVVEFRDITKQKRAEEQLVQALKKAEESDQLKSAFLANMSHEIRTPMNGILGFTSLLEEPDLTGEEQTQYIEIIKRSGMRMLNTVNDIIDISKIDAGQMEINSKEVNICIELENQYHFFKPEADSKGLGLSYHKKNIPDDLAFVTDPNKLRSILTNLIKNAIKYTDKGSVEIIAETDNDFFICSVNDTGIGIPSQRLNSIFNRFEQADISDSRAAEGSGLGLAITKSYIEMMHGEINVNSIEGEGSAFSFKLPLNGKTK